MLAAVIHHDPKLLWPALGLATLGNSLGGMSSYALGWLLPKASAHPRVQSRLHLVRRFGAPVLLLSWVPIIGDALCVAAGWLRLPWLAAALFMAVGKFLRYYLLAMVLV